MPFVQQGKPFADTSASTSRRTRKCHRSRGAICHAGQEALLELIEAKDRVNLVHKFDTRSTVSPQPSQSLDRSLPGQLGLDLVSEHIMLRPLQTRLSLNNSAILLFFFHF